METFQTLREKAGLTREEAATLLHRKPKTIQAYELSYKLPSLEILKNMVSIYETDYSTIFKALEEHKIKNNDFLKKHNGKVGKNEQ